MSRTRRWWMTWFPMIPHNFLWFMSACDSSWFFVIPQEFFIISYQTRLLMIHKSSQVFLIPHESSWFLTGLHDSWLLMIPYESLWFLQILYNSLQIFMIPYNSSWPSVINDSLRFYIVYDSLQFLMNLSDFSWFLMIQESSWIITIPCFLMIHHH